MTTMGCELGFGMMRLPQKNGTVDVPDVCEMADEFLSRGFTYFDTAFVYHGGASENVVKEVLSKRHARDKFRVASKLTIRCLAEYGTPEKMIREQFARTGLEYFDTYLLHAVDHGKFEALDHHKVWEFLFSARERGLAKRIGFSFHDSAEVLEELLTRHPGMDYVQLQINYGDWENPSVQSRKCYETARRHGLSVIVMEPVKGGMLAGALPPEIRAALDRTNPHASSAEWALRFAGSLDGVELVLSGMSDKIQLRENLDTFSSFHPLSPQENAAVREAMLLLEKIPVVPCTGCRYCVDVCPRQIPIPNLMNVLNSRTSFGDSQGVRSSYAWFARTRKASDCIACGACVPLCPQHICIPDELKHLAELLES